MKLIQACNYRDIRGKKDRPYEYVCNTLYKSWSFYLGKDADEAVYNAVGLEEVAKMASYTELINKDVKPAPQTIADKHYLRKHGEDAYYGQD